MKENVSIKSAKKHLLLLITLFAFLQQRAQAQSPNLLVSQDFVTGPLTDAFPPAGWTSSPAQIPSGDPNVLNSGWRYSGSSYLTNGRSTVTYKDSNKLATPFFSGAKSMTFRISESAGDTSRPFVIVEYCYQTDTNTYFPLDTLLAADFNGSTPSGTWNLIRYDLSGITGTYRIQFRDARGLIGAPNGTGSPARSRYLDSVRVVASVSVDTTYFRTRADGNFSNYANWSYWDGEYYQNAAINIIPLSTNHVIVKNATVLDTSYTTGSGRTLRDSTTGSTFTIAAGKSYATLGTGTANFAAQLVTVQSNASGTGKIGQSTPGSITATNVTVERYIPAKPNRKWSFISSPFGSQTIRNGWQQQIFITGSGTGGTPCGTGAGNGGTADKYNANGFDDTQNDPSSMDGYANTVNTNNSRWTQISGTGISLTPGLGYRVNVRGDRSVVNACASQINYSGASPAADAVTLKTSGTYSSTASASLNTYSSIANTLLGNPYSCELSFTAFQAANSGSIANKVWIYAGNTANTSDLYSAWNAGQVTNAQFLPAANLVGTAPNYTNIIIPSGGAFFIERANSGTSVSFAETHKTAVIASGNGIFSKTTLIPWTNFLRARLQSQADTISDLDNIIVRFSNDPGVSNSSYGALDGYSFNPATATVASLKGASRMAIQTRVSTVNADTVNLFVGYTPGTYRLKFDQFENFTSLSSLYLLDYFLNTATSLKDTGSYNFDITGNTLSQGGNRFALAFGFVNTPLSIKFITVGAKAMSKGAAVNFTVGSETDIHSYSVERSDNAVTFYTASTIKATGAGSYTIVDNKDLSEGTTLYRVKATDINGQTVFSRVVN